MTLRDVVRDQMHDTMTFVFASGGVAKRIQEDLTQRAFPVKKNAGRRTTAVDTTTLPRGYLPASWLLMVLVHDESDVAAVAAWAKGKDLSRIVIYFPPGTDLVAGMKPWAAQKLPTPAHVSHFRAIPAFRQEAGIRINERIASDFGS